MHAVNLSALLVGSRCQKSDEGMLLMAGLSAEGRYQLFSVSQRPGLDVTLSRPGTVKTQHLEIFVVHIHAGAVNFFHFQRLAALVYQADASRDNVLFFKNGIAQDHLEAQDRVF